MKIGIFYCGITGNTATIARQLAEKIPTSRLYPVAQVTRIDFESCELLILGTSSWHSEGDRLQNDWNDAYDCLREANLKDKQVAIYGVGDQIAYPDAFVDGMRALYDLVVGAGATVIGKWPDAGYDYRSSAAVEGDFFVGLPLDMDNQREQTPERVSTWALQLQREAGIL